MILAVAFFVVPKPWSPGSKYWLVLGATVVICVLLYEGVLRRFAIARVLFGIKTREPPAPLASSSTANVENLANPRETA